KIAAKLAVGYTLDELTNDITKATPASFEPTIDYVVTKIPRFTFEKFPDADPLLSTSMKSVGEAMSVGRTFAESLQKGLRSLETGLNGLNEISLDDSGAPTMDKDALRLAMTKPRPDRLLVAAQGLRAGMSADEVHRATKFDPWFVAQLKAIVDIEAQVRAKGLPSDRQGLLRLKKMGFADSRLAELTGKKAADVFKLRHQLGVRPVFKRIDTCAAEFASPTPYMYSCYEGDGLNEPECESEPSAKNKVIILGGGPNRIGQGIEFDYCCVHAAFALRDAGFETIMVNCNPETVSTDYDTSNRLYFEPLTAEDVIELITTEQSNGKVLGVIVQLGGQTPLKLAHALEAAGIPILGTSPDAIDLAEDRERFQRLLEDLKLRQPANGTARSADEARAAANRIGYPVVIRPSYVLGGRAMRIVYDEAGVSEYIRSAMKATGDNPLLIDSYLSNAIEVDVDALCDGKDVYISGIMEHIEEAGIHSGDSACALPPHTLSKEIIADIRRQTNALALALKVVGLMNVQYAVKDGVVYILEVNPRASRTVPFVAKATGVPVAKIAARIMAGAKLGDFGLVGREGSAISNHVAVKEAVFPFNRFPGVDIVLGPEMKSTGEVMGLDTDFPRAYAKAQLGAGLALPVSGTAFLSVRERDKEQAVSLARRLVNLGFKVIATRGTQAALAKAGIPAEPVNKVAEGRPHCVDEMISGNVQMVINTTEGAQSFKDSFTIRRTALTRNICHYTTLSGAEAAATAIGGLKEGALDVAPLQSYFSR
ncbi:MAG: carbamoyl-phosphate synthase large subunit, partial [Rhodospirillaceae bacterium]|nr:carbamoyl-phosphate synthase large subunit [Rhodospirillaceae bacterium]